jgi:hypothetical protein
MDLALATINPGDTPTSVRRQHMKKILSALVALAFLATTAPAFAEEPAPAGAPAPAAEKKPEKKKKAAKKKKAEKKEEAAPAPAK